ncbi:hypothetical protein ACHAQA_002686 [Verticillium albo-atrum]
MTSLPLNLAPAELAGSTTTKIYHREPYPAISPTREVLSQAGRTVLVGGGSTGIGYSIAESFAVARATRIIILGRRQNVLDDAVARLAAEHPLVQVIGRTCDMSNDKAVDDLWTGLAQEDILVDVLIPCGAKVWSPHTILSLGTKSIWDGYVTNTKGPLQLAERFYKQEGRNPAHKLYLINVSSGAAHDFVTASVFRAYSATKLAALAVLQLLAADIKPEDMQVVSFHPGMHYTELAQSFFPEATEDFDDIKLPGDFAVWAASEEASFLHGRFVWAHWDVDELSKGPLRERVETDPRFLRVGIHGV